MSNISSDVRNYFKLELLIRRSSVLLRDLFAKRYSLFHNGQIWNNSPTEGNQLLASYKKIELNKIQKISVSNGDFDQWDLQTLIVLLLIIKSPTTLNDNEMHKQLDDEDKLLQQLKLIRNKLAHHPSKAMSDEEFNQLWDDLKKIHITFGSDETELNRLKKDNSMFEPQNETIDIENVKEALRLNSFGTQAHKEEKFTEAIELFTKATLLTGVSIRDRAVFYSNLSSSRLELYEQQRGRSNSSTLQDSTDQRYRALRDAKTARNLRSTWWKGHYRVGKVYAAINEHEKAINSYERALALDPSNDMIQKALDESRQIYSRTNRQEHFDPRLLPITMPEHLNEMQQRFGIDPQKVRAAHSLHERINQAPAAVVKGHKYEHGDTDTKQDYKQAARYFEKAANQGNAEGLYNLARLTDRGFGVKKDHKRATELYERAAAQLPYHQKLLNIRNTGVAEAEFSLGLRYIEGIVVHKSLSDAFYWFQRAAEHDSAEAPNSLALMYKYGEGVPKDLDKAEQFYELSASRGDPNAMRNLAYLLLDRNKLQMAKIWYDRACEAGNLLAQTGREEFEMCLYAKSLSFQQSNVNETTDSSLQITWDFDLIFKHAQAGSITAEKLYLAQTYLEKATAILEENDTLNEAQECEVIHKLAESFRSAREIIKILSREIYQRIGKLVDQVIKCCSIQSAATSQLDEDVRTCYATLYFDSKNLVLQFLRQCKQKYPQSIYFFKLSADLNMTSKNFEDALFDVNTGLNIDPNDYSLLYRKIFILLELHDAAENIIDSYQTFLNIAPKDHPEMPEIYYSFAYFYLIPDSKQFSIDIAEKLFEQGEQAEKLQLPCFIRKSYLSKERAQQILNKERPNTPSHSDQRQLRLTHPHRIEVIKRHRHWVVDLNKNEVDSRRNTVKPRTQQPTNKSLIGLKSISLRDMNPTKDHVYTGYIQWVPKLINQHTELLFFVYISISI